MPQISKVRIVNFQYNDGKRLIADELYDFSVGDGSNARDVLINLANGGGKSVLVQLMLQPIIPKAQVAKRRIESFFTRASDHCFVLLEWQKDDSTEKLLTGIAMAASAGVGGEQDDSRGMAIKYYTFYANYADSRPYDIVRMPLSRRENNRFITAEFDAVRQLAKKSDGALCYYSSDDALKWQRKLAEYGLIQSEWHMMERLNQEEGDLGDYFNKMSSADQLVDLLLIPTIEGKLSRKTRGEEDALVTMLLGYVEQYRAQQEVLHQRTQYDAFCSDLGRLKP